jgi:aryl-alcohol dehydrogenase-like predicted oxidoreductase
MEHTHIHPLKERVSRVALGTWAIGGWMWGGTDEKDSIAAIHQALDLGINMIDTAPAYGFGVAEEIVGKALKQYGTRDGVILSTKAGLNWEGPEVVYRDSRKERLEQELNDSLKRLQVDYIDIYHIHWPDTLVPLEETAEVLHQFLKQGKIRAVGASNFSVEQMKEFQKGGPLHVLQSPFNLFERVLEQKELSYSLQHKISFLGYGSLCRGLLSGQMSKKREFKGDDLRKGDPKFQEPRFTQYLNAAERLEQWAKVKHKKPLVALAIRWCLDKGVSSALWGARKPEQLKDVETVWGWKLSSEDFREIDQILKESIRDPVGPSMEGPPVRKLRKAS